MAKRIIEDLEELKTMVGQEIGVSDWIKVRRKGLIHLPRRPGTTSGFM